MNRALVIVAVTAAVVAGLYFGFSRSPALAPPRAAADVPAVAPPAAPAVTPSAGAPTVAAPPAAAPPEEAPKNAYAIAIRNGRPQAPDVIRVREGDRVTLTIATDRAGTLEVHGYREEVKLEANTQGTLAFVATKSGRFGIDMHERSGGHIEVTALEVLPK
jgi:hypothetical protein